MKPPGIIVRYIPPTPKEQWLACWRKVFGVPVTREESKMIWRRY